MATRIRVAESNGAKNSPALLMGGGL